MVHLDKLAHFHHLVGNLEELNYRNLEEALELILGYTVEPPVERLQVRQQLGRFCTLVPDRCSEQIAFLEMACIGYFSLRPILSF